MFLKSAQCDPLTLMQHQHRVKIITYAAVLTFFSLLCRYTSAQLLTTNDCFVYGW